MVSRGLVKSSGASKKFGVKIEIFEKSDAW